MLPVLFLLRLLRTISVLAAGSFPPTIVLRCEECHASACEQAVKNMLINYEGWVMSDIHVQIYDRDGFVTAYMV